MTQKSNVTSKIITEIVHLLSSKYKELSDQEETFQFPKLFFKNSVNKLLDFFMRIVVTKNIGNSPLQ